MPIEIRELVIRAYVEEASEDNASSQAVGAEGREEIIADCLEQVGEMLKQQQER
jgi:hypothetical protein